MQRINRNMTLHYRKMGKRDYDNTAAILKTECDLMNLFKPCRFSQFVPAILSHSRLPILI